MNTAIIRCPICGIKNRLDVSLEMEGEQASCGSCNTTLWVITDEDHGRIIQDLKKSACEAEETMDLDDLERFASAQRKENEK